MNMAKGQISHDTPAVMSVAETDETDKNTQLEENCTKMIFV